MNPFELQAEFMRQWLGLVSAAGTTMADACLAVGRHSVERWGSDNVRSPAAPGFTWPMLQWPANPYQPNSFVYSNPFAMASAWNAWPMAMSSWPMSYTASPFASAPWQFVAFPNATAPWGWASPWTMPGTAGWGPFQGWRMGPPSAAELIDQVATAYRSASGHAMATVLGPMGAPLDPRNYGVPWWQAATQRH